jgi:hypothetical protein
VVLKGADMEGEMPIDFTLVCVLFW